MEIETGPKIVPPSEMLLIVKWMFNEVVLIQLPVYYKSITLISLVAWDRTSPRAFLWRLRTTTAAMISSSLDYVVAVPNIDILT
jgi:hypothetical protein